MRQKNLTCLTSNNTKNATKEERKEMKIYESYTELSII